MDLGPYRGWLLFLHIVAIFGFLLAHGISVGVAFSITVTAYDAYGNLATGYVGTVHFGSSDPRAALPANYTFSSGPGGETASTPSPAWS